MYTFLPSSPPPVTRQDTPYATSSNNYLQQSLDEMILPLPRLPQIEEEHDDAFQEDHKSYTSEFIVEEDKLLWNDIPLMQLVEQYGTPFKLTYLPNISEHIQHAKSMFERAMERHNYQGSYTYCYCMKFSHFRFVLDEVLRNDVRLEISSAFDIPIVRELYRTGKIGKSTHIVCNGHKQSQYTKQIGKLVEEGFNVLPVLDSVKELDAYTHVDADAINIGIRIAADESPDLPFRTSRLGLRYSEVSALYRTRIQNSNKLRLKMLYFFVDSGIRDTKYYWSGLSCFVHKYCELRKICAHLESLNIGGGLPIAHSLDFSYDYENMVDRIVALILKICVWHNVPVPHLFTEFGSYTVGESGAVIYEIIEQKQQNAKEMWYMIDGSFITQLPDTWATKQDFICLALNKWSNTHRKVMLGGLTCDAKDYYPSKQGPEGVNLPMFDEGTEKQYIGFFHTGAYQEALGGYGGISHCLIPAPKHIIVDKNEKGQWKSRLFAPEQESEGMMQLIGYTSTSTSQHKQTNLK